MQIFLTYILPPLISLVFGLVSAYLIRRMNLQFEIEDSQRKAEMIKIEEEHQAYLAQREEQKRENTRNLIREELEPIINEIAALHVELGYVDERIEGCVETEAQHIAAIRVSYRYRLITLCRTYLRQGFITADQFDQLNEFYNVYRSIGGNGQAEEYYNRIQALEIHGDEESAD